MWLETTRKVGIIRQTSVCLISILAGRFYLMKKSNYATCNINGNAKYQYANGEGLIFNWAKL